MPSDDPAAGTLLQDREPLRDCNQPLGLHLLDRTGRRRRIPAARLALVLARGRAVSDQLFAAAVAALDAIDAEYPETEWPETKRPR